MADPVPLSFDRHGKLRLSEISDFTQFSTQHIVPVVFQEFYELATEFPLVFVRNSESGDFAPVAMMGLTQGRNLYCQTSNWALSFIPTSFTFAPLSLRRSTSGADQAVACIDEESPLLSESVGEPIFNAAGNYTDYLQQRIDRLALVTRQTLQTNSLCQLFAEKKLLKTRPLSLQSSANTTRYEVEGVYTIDEEALEALDDTEFFALRQRGLLPLIYSHLTSLQQFGRLLRLQTHADQAE
ncbi:MAG: SapC family protein [Pseudomonadales bacterium]